MLVLGSTAVCLLLDSRHPRTEGSRYCGDDHVVDLPVVVRRLRLITCKRNFVTQLGEVSTTLTG